jgi:hypothetical protein
MRLIGFSTGALTRGDFRAALQILEETHVHAVELSALRQNELIPLIRDLNDLDLREFQYKSFHAPSVMDRDFEPIAIDALHEVALRGWPIIIHPDAMYDLSRWEHFGDLLCIENMDKRKPMGQTVAHLSEVFKALPRASLCFDIGHARQVDPTMSEAAAILQFCNGRLRQLHISEVNSQSKHDPLSFESILAFRRVAHLIPETVPVIVESRVVKDKVDEEIQNVRKALSFENVLALVGGWRSGG